MADNLFEGLTPPSHPEHQQPQEDKPSESFALKSSRNEAKESSPKPILKGSLKRSKPSESIHQPQVIPAEKRSRFKTTTDASETQVIEAMQKIASHIKNPSKFAKASKLAIQLIQAGSVSPGTSYYFFAILEAAMSSATSCNDPSVRGDYHALFLEAQSAAEILDKKQRNQLTAWTLSAVLTNDLFTDDSFVFSKTASKLKDELSSLPIATEDDDAEEAATLKDEPEVNNEDGGNELGRDEEIKKDESDPFGLDALIPNPGKKDERAKGKKDVTAMGRKEDEEETKRFLKLKRKALITCLEIAARRYKTVWCQTVIDILVKHAFDNVARFTSKQRDAIGKLWASVREQQVRRKQGKSVSGQLDMNGFERFQQKYSTEKMSIRRSVGSSGERRAQQWLG